MQTDQQIAEIENSFEVHNLAELLCIKQDSGFTVEKVHIKMPVNVLFDFEHYIKEEAVKQAKCCKEKIAQAIKEW